jgi:hypothetical protein
MWILALVLIVGGVALMARGYTLRPSSNNGLHHFDNLIWDNRLNASVRLLGLGIVFLVIGLIIAVVAMII